MSDRWTRGWWWTRAVLLGVFGVVLVRTAWNSDDAYILFRAVENACDGFGLRWNVAERVSVNPCPLWMFLLLAGRALTGEIYFTALALAGMVSVIAVFLVGFKLARHALAGAIAIGALLSSRAFVDYSTSGLENPAVHLFLAVFAVVWLREETPRRHVLQLSAVAALLTLSRLDSVLLVLPAWIVAVRRNGWLASIRPALIGFLPLIAWLLFATFYYGTPFPIIAYAKAFCMGVSTVDLAAQSVWYYAWLGAHDPITAVIIGAGLVLPWTARRRDLAPLVLGVLVYLLYIVKIGGDFMGGRFFAAPLLLSVIVLASLRVPGKPVVAVTLLAAVLGIGLIGGTPTIASGADYGKQEIDAHGIDDERAFYYGALGLLSPDRRIPVAGSLPAALWKVDPNHRFVAVGVAVGVQGFECGPNVHAVDVWLLDPLLARLPTIHPKHWRIGHFSRRIPEGYLETLISGENRIMHPGLAAYYENLQTVLRGNPWSWARLRAMIRLWTGTYAAGFEAFVAGPYRSPPRVELDLADVSTPLPAGTKWFDGKMRIVYEGGLDVRLGRVRSDRRIELGLDGLDGYTISFLRDGEVRGHTAVVTSLTFPGGLEVKTVHVPEAVSAGGYDTIRVTRIASADLVAALGYIRFGRP